MSKLQSKFITGRFIGAICLVFLTACTAIGPGPTLSVVQQALTMQISQTQGQLVSQLQLSRPPSLEITALRISHQKPLLIDDLQGFKVEGTYDFMVKLPQQVIKQSNKSFEVYLQRQKRAQTWRLARPLKSAGEGTDKWVTFFIENGE